ncbi:MarR family transcriptional regulator [Promicromonospora sp. Marseille-Q5078]
MSYHTKHEQPLTSRLPLNGPAAPLIYGDDGCCQTLCLDLDTTNATADDVTSEAARLTAWLTECGARTFADISPNGGRHIYIPLRDRLPYTAARELVEALQLIFPTLDPSPHRSIQSGCIRTPGSLHKSGQAYQELTTLLPDVVDLLEHHRNSPDVVQTIQTRLRPQIHHLHVQRAPETHTGLADTHISTARDGRISQRILDIARNATYDPTRYPSPSEARAAVMTAAVAAGWSLTDVVTRLEDGRWRGLASLYAHHQDTRRRILRDWRTATTHVSAHPPAGPQVRPAASPRPAHVRRSNTSEPSSQGGYPHLETTGLQPGTHQAIRTWRAALRATEHHRFPGRAGRSSRILLRTIAEFAHKKSTTRINVGTRALAVGAGMDHSTVSALLHALAGAGWVAKVSSALGESADVWELALPADLRERAASLRWDKGKAHGLRPAFRVLGHVAAFVFEAIESGAGTSVAGVARATGMSRSAAHEAVEMLCAWGLVERGVVGRLTARPENLVAVAEQLGAVEAVAAQLAAYRRQRRLWRMYLQRHEIAREDATDEPEEAWRWPLLPHGLDEWTVLAATGLARTG